MVSRSRSLGQVVLSELSMPIMRVEEEHLVPMVVLQDEAFGAGWSTLDELRAHSLQNYSRYIYFDQ